MGNKFIGTVVPAITRAHRILEAVLFPELGDKVLLVLWEYGK